MVIYFIKSSAKMGFHIAELCQAEGEDKSTSQEDQLVCFGLGFNQWPKRKKMQQITPLLGLLFCKFGLWIFFSLSLSTDAEAVPEAVFLFWVCFMKKRH